MSDSDSDSQLQAGLLGRWDAQRRFWRLLAIGALIVTALLIVVSSASLYLAITTSSSVHAQRTRSEAVSVKVDKVLGIAQGFACQQTPTAKGCPPQPPSTNNTQAVIDQVVNRIVTQIEQIYPPPEAP